MSGPESFPIRMARQDDIPALRALVDASVRALSCADYTAAEIEGSVGAVLGLDTQLVRDGTYFLAETQHGAIAAAGGWSYRGTTCGADDAPHRSDVVLDARVHAAKIRAIFTHPDWARQGLGSRMLHHCEQAAYAAGFRRAEMGSTLTGAPVYAKHGYQEEYRFAIPLANGARLGVVFMTKTLTGDGR